jgi:hypothetical protein
MLINRQTGSALVISIVMGIIFSIAGVTILKVATRGSDMTKRDIETIKTYWANEGILRLALRAISLDEGDSGYPSDVFGSGDQQVSFNQEINLNGYVLSGANREIDLTIRFLECCNGAYNITVKTLLHGDNLYNINRVDTAVIKSIQRYTFFEDTTAETDLKWKEFVVDGDFHSNGIVRLTGDMSEKTHVTGHASTSGTTSPAESYPDPYDMGITIDDDAKGTEAWLKTRFPEYSHSGKIQTDFLSPKSFPDNYILNSSGNPYTTDLAFKFEAGGVTVYRWVTASSYWAKVTVTPGNIIKTKGNAYVWGTVSGQYTIVSDSGKNIYIAGNITYNNGETGTDALGLVSGNNIVIPNSFTLNLSASTPYSYNFTTAAATNINACMFMKYGGLTVENIDNYTKQAATSALGALNVSGCALVKQDKDKIWEYENNTVAGLNCTYTKDKRFFNNMIAPPGIPFPKALDEERTDQYSEQYYMWVIAPGKWYNYLEPAP